MKTTNILMFVAVIAVVFAAISLAVTINKIGDFKALTGFATDIGTANLSLTGTAQVNFTTDALDFGTGYVPTGKVSCEIDTEGNSNCTGLGALDLGLVLENIGNVDVTINLSTDKDADGFLGGVAATPMFEYYVIENKSASCSGATNITSWVSANTTTILACDNLSYEANNDTLEVELRLVIPSDSAGDKGAIITATVTAIP